MLCCDSGNGPCGPRNVRTDNGNGSGGISISKLRGVILKDERL